MKKSIEKLLVRLSKSDKGEFEGGFTAIKGGANMLFVQDNGTVCDNSGVACTGSNSGTCTNANDCTHTDNGYKCTNKIACLM